MRAEFYPLAVPASGTHAAGSAFAVAADLEQKSVQVGGTWSGSVAIELSFDGSTTWSSVATITTNGITQIPQVCQLMRVNTTSIVSGVPTVTLGGFNRRTV